MLVSYYTKRKLKRSLLFGLLTAVIGLGFLFEYLNIRIITPFGVLFGFLFGFVLCLTEEFLLYRILRRINTITTLVLKFIIYMLLLCIIFFLEIIFYSRFYGLDISPLPDFLLGSNFIISFLYALIAYDYLVVLMYIEGLLGRGRFIKYTIGAYRKPIGEDRIFMFIDMNNSTELAEDLGGIKYFNLLNDCFHDLSEPVLKTRADIYQFVGDEVVLTWKMKEGLMHFHCVRAFFQLEEMINQKAGHYMKTYGVVPGFKAGLHCGHVLAAEIGDLKKEIVYNGDVLNTTARICSECSRENQKFLLSKRILDLLPIRDDGTKSEFRFTSMGPVSLKGKHNPIELYNVDLAGEK